MDGIDKAFDFGYLYGLGVAALLVLLMRAIGAAWWSPLIGLGSAASVTFIMKLWRAH